MSTTIPYLSPLRFHAVGSDYEIDYENNLLQFDLMYLRQEYQRGVMPVSSIYPDFALNNVLSLLIYGVFSVAYIRNMITNEAVRINAKKLTSIIPNPRVFECNIEAEGFYRIETKESTGKRTTFYSDVFFAKNLPDHKDLVKITYSDSLNRNGGYFFDENGDSFWTPSAFYTGILRKGATEYDRTVYSDQPNNTTVLKSTPKLIDNLTLCDIHQTYYDNISYQLSCDTIFINDVQYAVEDTPTFELKDDNTDVGDVTIKLSRNNNNGFQQIL